MKIDFFCTNDVFFGACNFPRFSRINLITTNNIWTAFNFSILSFHQLLFGVPVLRTDHVSMLCTGTLSYLGSIMEKERRVVLINDLYAIREHNYVLVCYIFI